MIHQPTIDKLPKYFEEKNDMGQIEVRLLECDLDDRYIHDIWNCTEYVYYLNDYMIDLENMRKNDKMSFLKYMKEVGKYREI